MKKYLLVAVFVSLGPFFFFSCQQATGSNVKVVSTWNGTFSGQNSGTVSNWILRSDNSMSGTWVTSGTTAVSLSLNGTYTLAGTSFAGTATGTGTSQSSASAFSSTYTGTLSGSSGTGTYRITFTNKDWAADSGTFTVTKQ